MKTVLTKKYRKAIQKTYTHHEKLVMYYDARRRNERKMNYSHWIYDKSEGVFVVYLNKEIDGVKVDMSISISVDTLVKWYDINTNKTKLILIKNIRSIFVMNEIRFNGEHVKYMIPLLPAKEIADEFLGQYEGLLGIGNES